MKRFLICAFSIIMALLTALLGGCSCSGCVENFPLAFTNDFLGGGTNDAPSGYSETITYNVKNENHFNNDLEKASDLTEEVIKYEYIGTCVITFSQKATLPSGVESNLDLVGKTFYYLKTRLDLVSTYTVNGTYAEGYENATTENGDVNYMEYVESEVYFLQKGQSYAPVYARTEQKNTFVSLADGTANIKVSQTSTETTYNKSRYKLTKTIDGKTSKESHSYSYKIAIDNTQLLFIVRNIELNKGSSFSLPTVAPSYSSPQTLIVKNENEDTKSYKINGEDKSMPVKNLSITRNDTFNKGQAHYVVLQKSQVAGLPFKSYMLQYAAPLTTYNSFSSMGALVYTIASINN